MLSLSAFRSLSLLSLAPTQAIRHMAVKAAASSAAPKAKGSSKKTESTKSAKTATKTKAKATKKAEKTKAAKPKAKKAESKPKPKPKVKPIDLPKRPGTAWSLFFVEHLDKVKASGKEVVPVAETANASAIWKQLSDEQKKKYDDKYRANLAEFKKQMEQRLQELSPAEFKLENSRRQALRAAGKKSLPSLKDPNAPKRPLSSFFLFARELRESGKYSALPLRDQAKTFAEAWGKASESEKADYTKRAQDALTAYKAEKAAYEASKQ
ncbi:exp1-like protein [Mortierella sp. AD011]|nr:exp1-like protein [Mortierella sp. AD011]